MTSRVLSDRVAVVAGTSPNIGGGIAESLAGAGATVVAVDAKEDYARRCAAAIQAGGGQASAIRCDVTDEADVQQTVKSVVDRYGQIDVLVNGAVYFTSGGVVTMDVTAWRAQIDLILTGTFLATKHVVKSMLDAGRTGVVINLASTAAHQGEPHNLAYTTAKAGILNFTRAAATELGPYGIRVNSLTPTTTSPADTVERLKRWGLPERSADLSPAQEDARSRVPLRRLPSTTDYGRAAVFLASDDAAMVTGIDLRVDAGALAAYWRTLGSP